MSLRTVGVLFIKEIRYAPKNFIFMFALGIPIVLSLILSLAFGTVFAGKPTFGVVDLGESQLPVLAANRESLILREYGTVEALEAATARGAVDIGVVLPGEFDQRVRAGEVAEIDAYVWGESLLKDRAILGATIAVFVREIAGQDAPIEILETIVGDEDSIPWEVRLLPFVVLISMLLAGTFVPATSIVEEKMKRTLGALVVAPSTLGEIFTAKALLGASISVVMAVVVLLINNAFGAAPGSLMVALVFGAISASVFGVFLGVLMKDINTLFATLKAIGILLYAPVILDMFPQIPGWISRLFPTYYIINPITMIAQESADLAAVSIDLLIQLSFVLVMVIMIGVINRRARLSEV